MLPRGLVSGVGAGGTALVLALQPGLLGWVMVALVAMGSMPLLLISTLALIAVYSSNPARQAAAEKVLDRLLITLRPK